MSFFRMEPCTFSLDMVMLLSASDFGETDTTTGEWKIKTDPSVSYGTNGFLDFKRW